MAESTVLAFPAQGKSSPARASCAAPPLDQRRWRRALALVPTVRAVDGGFRVSSSCRELRYLVTQPNGHRVCTCPDYGRHAAEAGFRCKHVIAVDLALEGGRLPAVVPGRGPERVPAPVPAPLHAVPAALAVLPHGLAGDDLVRLKLIKTSKGYAWEISVAERDPEAALSRLQELEQKVQRAFGGQPAQA